MAYDGGIITREDLFTQEALEVGAEYAKNLEQAIDANKRLIESVKEINNQANFLRQVKTQSDYVKVLDNVIQKQKELKEIEVEMISLEGKMIESSKKKANQEEKANEVARLSEIRLQQQREKAFDNYEKRLQKQEQLEKKKAEQEEKARIRLEKMNEPYKKLELALNEVRNQAKNLKAEMFLLEQQGKKNDQSYRNLEIRSKALTLQTNILDKGIKDIDKSLGQHQREVGNYAIAADALGPVFGRINSQLSIFGTSIEKLSSTKSPFKQLTTDIVQFGKSVGTFLLTPVGAVLAVLGSLFALIGGNKQTVADFNSGLINVGKTTGLADAELTKLGGDIVSLSKKLKVVGTPALMEYATVAGQLGVKGSKNILAFTEALAMLETASNIKGEEGGSDIARLLTLADGGVQNVKKFGDEIVNLGNNFAATEKEILSNSTSIAQNTTVYKTGRQDILAYGTATKAVGIESELAGSKIGKAMKFLEASIRTGENLTEVMKLTGLSVEELRTQFKNDSGGVLFKFIEGLHEIDKAGGSVIGTLNELGIKEERQERVLSALATGGFATLANAMETVKNSSGAMTQEFETFSSKLILQWGKMRIAWDNFILSIENGEGPFAELTLGISKFGTSIIEAITPTQQLSSEISNEVFAVNKLIAEISSLNEGNKKREDLINKLKNQYPDFIKHIDNEDFSNKNLLSTLKEVNKEYLSRIQLQQAVETAESTKNAIIEVEKGAADAQKRLFDILTKARVNWGLETEIDLNNILDSAKKIEREIKGLGGSGLLFSDRSEINKAIVNVELLNSASEKLGETYKKETQYSEDLSKALGFQTEEQKRLLKEAREHYNTLEKYYDTLDESGKPKAVTVTKTPEENEKEKKAAEKAQRDREKLLDDQLKNAKTAYEKQMDLEIFKAKRTVEINKDLANDEKRTMEERMLSFETYSTESFNLKQKEAEKEFTLASNYTKGQKALTNDEIQAYLEGNVSIDNLTHEQQLVLEKWYDTKNALRKKEVKDLEDHVKKEADIILKRSLISLDTSENKDLEKLNAKYAEDLKSFTGNEKEKKKLTEQFETDKRKIQNDSSKKRIDEEIKNAKKLIELTEADDDKKKQLLNDLQKFKTRLSEIELEEQKELLDKKLEKEKEYHQKLKDLSRDLYQAVGDFVNVLFDARVQRIDEDIEQTNKKYEQEFQLAQGNEKEQARIRLRQQADIDKLEEKKKKERYKQAVFNKAMGVMEIGINTAVGITKALPNFVLAALVAALGAVQLATVLATPIPKYEFGTRGKKHKGGIAEVGEKRPEVVLEPGREPYLISKRGYYDLPKGTEVIPSLDEYKRLQRTTMMMSLVNEKQDLDTYQMNMVFDSAYGAEIVKELKELNNKKQNIIVKHSTKVDVGHDFWMFNNMKWKN
ncbi:phage tail tape measure protein [Myroides odoratus]|uniref:phage tail tape measure protein n=1 Tax=Myroides odoratus TaxID=256 RepID=UPI00334208ED